MIKPLCENTRSTGAELAGTQYTLKQLKDAAKLCATENITQLHVWLKTANIIDIENI